MSLFDTLLGIFTDDDTNTEFNQNPEGFLNQNGLGNVTSQDIEAEMPRVLEAIQGNSGGATQGGAASFAGSGNVTLPPPPAPSGPGLTPIAPEWRIYPADRTPDKVSPEVLG